jgi:hypothetical protein
VTIQWHNGKLLFVNGLLAMSPACCCQQGCAEPCSNTGPQDNVNITVSGTCASGCKNAAGEYIGGFTIEGPTTCQWDWYKGSWPSGWVFRLIWDKTTFLWTGRLTYMGGYSDYSYASTGVLVLSCSGGKLSGGFDLAGRAAMMNLDCSGCVAHVSL